MTSSATYRFFGISLVAFCFAFLTQMQAFAQSVPQRFSYQAVIRDDANQLLNSQSVGIRLSILQGSATGTAVYVETHTASTSSNGLVSLQVGGGTVVTGTLAQIDWSSGPYFIKTETDPLGGTNYTITGTSQMLSVPYALQSGNGLAGGTLTNQMNYWNGTAWVTLSPPQTQGQVLTFCNGSLTWTIGGVCPATLPTLTTTAASTITSTTASSGGNITADGGAAITARGVCWSTSQNPTIALTTKTSDGTGTGTFTSNLTGLSPNTLYYVRAYATNSAGTAYGNQISFSTPSANPVDADGNTYTTVTIGSQVWMKENLKTSKYRNGDAIPTGLADLTWQYTTSGAYAIYNNDAANNTTYGKLYNWYAVADPRGLCPAGWHVPTDAEWYILENYLDPTVNDPNATGIRGTDVGGKLKAVSSLWTSPNTGATNSSGFTGLPGGYRGNYGQFYSIGVFGNWWSSTQSSSASAGGRYLDYNNASSFRFIGFAKTTGYYVRCLRD